jgi:WD40 repeat protein
MTTNTLSNVNIVNVHTTIHPTNRLGKRSRSSLDDELQLTDLCFTTPKKVVGSRSIGPMIVGVLSIPDSLCSFTNQKNPPGRLGFYRLSITHHLELMSMSPIFNSRFCMAFSSFHKILVTVDETGTCTIWRMNSKETAMIPIPTPILIADQIPGKKMDKVTRIAFDPTTGLLAMATEKGNVMFWKVSDDKVSIDFLAIFNAHQGEITSIVFDPFNRFMATASMDNTAILWRIDLSKSYVAIPLASLFDKYDDQSWNGVRSIALNKMDPNCVVIGDGDGTVKMWDISDMKNLRCQRTINGIKGTPSYVGFINNDGPPLLGIVNGHKINMFQVVKSTLVPVPVPKDNDPIRATFCCFDQDSYSIITLNRDWVTYTVQIRVWKAIFSEKRPRVDQHLVDENPVDSPQTKRPRNE